MSDINPLELIRALKGEATDDWLLLRAKQTGFYPLEDWLWWREKEARDAHVEELEKAKGMNGRVGTEA